MGIQWPGGQPDMHSWSLPLLKNTIQTFIGNVVDGVGSIPRVVGVGSIPSVVAVGSIPSVANVGSGPGADVSKVHTAPGRRGWRRPCDQCRRAARMSPRVAAPRVEELVEEGELVPVRVEGWNQDAFMSPDARMPRKIQGASLLSPFDPLVWFRPRAERVFDFRYRIEIYVPESKRRWGYYVLPFRLGEHMVARVDLKADRRERRLVVQRVHYEEGFDRKKTESALAGELGALADWLGLQSVVRY